MLASRATVLTYDPRGAGASERPARGYDFPMHAADALAVLGANDIGRASLVTVSRSMNTAILLATADPGRFNRIAAIAPNVEMEIDPSWPDPETLEEWRSDWAGFVVPFMREVFTEPDSDDVIAEVAAIGLEATPEIIVTQEFELDWRRPAELLGTVSCPTLLIHGELDATTPVSRARSIMEAMADAQLEVIPVGGIGRTSAPLSR
jgi:pimeloyl-ACP methyl ester carboxylesterase